MLTTRHCGSGGGADGLGDADGGGAAQHDLLVWLEEERPKHGVLQKRINDTKPFTLVEFGAMVFSFIRRMVFDWFGLVFVTGVESD